MSRGREPAGGGVSNPPSRRAVCEQHLYGSVRGAPREGGAYSIAWGGIYSGRDEAYRETLAARQLEAALDPEGLSTTARAVLAVIVGRR